MPRVWRATPLHPLLPPPHRLDPARASTRPDVGALRRALGALEDGRVVGIFPEGPFSVRGRLERGPARRGAAGAALRACRSCPPASTGTYAGARRTARLRPAPPSARACASARRAASRARPAGAARRAAASRSGSWTTSPRSCHEHAEDLGRARSRGRRADPTAERFTGSLALRPAAVAARHRRQHRVGARARARRAAHRRRARRDRRGAGPRPGRARAGHVPVPAGARGHPHERRAPAHRADRRRSAASCTPAARATIRSRSTSASTSGTSVAAHARGPARGRSRRWSTRAAETRRRADARLHAPAARAAGRARASPARVRVHARARPRALRRLRGRRADVLPLGAAALAGTAFPIDREALARDLGFAAVIAEQPRRRQRPRLRARVPGRGRHHRHAPLAARRRPHAVGHRGVRLRRVLRRVRHRLVDHAAEEEPRRGRADPRQERTALRQPRRPCSRR